MRARVHPTSEQLRSYLSGGLSWDDAEHTREHLDQCAPCRDALGGTVLPQALATPLGATQTSPRGALPVSGDVVAGRFRIERLIGMGGMGSVYEAHQLLLNQRVALKFLLPEFARDASVVDRFTREARAAARLVTEHVGRVLDLCTLPNGEPYLVMELLEGESLDRRLEREGPLPSSVAARLVRDATFALEEAHALGIVHRDLKPANLFLSRRPNGSELLKVLDFGVAKSVHPDIEAGLGSTSQGSMIGTPLFMAPEQLTAAGVDGRTDIWALGCVLHQLVSGTPPFDGKDVIELMYRIQRSPHARLPAAAASLSAVVDRCLAKDRADRFQSVVALRLALEVALVQAPPADPGPSTFGRARVMGAAFLAMAGMGAAGWWLFRPASRPNAPQEPGAEPAQRLELSRPTGPAPRPPPPAIPSLAPGRTIDPALDDAGSPPPPRARLHPRPSAPAPVDPLNEWR